MLLVGSQFSYELRHASPRLLADAGFVLQALRDSPPPSLDDWFEEIRLSLKIDDMPELERLVLEQQHGSRDWFESVAPSLRDDAALMLSAVGVDVRTYALASERLRGDEAFCRAAIARNGRVLSEVPEHLCRDVELVKLALRTSRPPLSLPPASLACVRDRELAALAVANHGDSYRGLPEALQRDAAVAAAVVRGDPSRYAWLPTALRDEADLALLALDADGDASDLFGLIGARLRADAQFWLAACARCAGTLSCMTRLAGARPSDRFIDGFVELYPQSVWTLTDEQIEDPRSRRLAALSFSEKTRYQRGPARPDSIVSHGLTVPGPRGPLQQAER
jgi:hypothetical protein